MSFAAGDIPLIAVAFTVIMIFATLVLFVKDRVYSKVSLALVGITTVALSIGAAFGLSLYFTIPFTSLSQVCFFHSRLCLPTARVLCLFVCSSCACVSSVLLLLLSGGLWTPLLLQLLFGMFYPLFLAVALS